MNNADRKRHADMNRAADLAAAMDDDTLVRNLTAFTDWADLLFSITEHGYTPTLTVRRDDPGDLQGAVRELRSRLIRAGLPVFPAPAEPAKA